MKPELQKYYEARFDMMASQGWKDFIEDIQNMVNSYDKVERIKAVEDLYFTKGQLDILNWVINLQETSSEAYKELSDEKDI